MSIQISDSLIKAAKSYDASHIENVKKYASKEEEVQTKKSEFKTAVDGLLGSIEYTHGVSAISSKDIKYIFENLKPCKKAQQKMIDWYAKFKEKHPDDVFVMPKEETETTSKLSTPQATVLLGMEFDIARDELRTIKEYVNERKVRKEFKKALAAEITGGADFETIKTDLKTQGVSAFVLERATAFSKKKKDPVVEEQKRAAFLEFIKC
jgi:hypothetical protein